MMLQGHRAASVRVRNSGHGAGKSEKKSGPACPMDSRPAMQEWYEMNINIQTLPTR